MGLKIEGIIFLFMAWAAILTFVGYMINRFLPIKKLKQNSINFIRRWSVD